MSRNYLVFLKIVLGFWVLGYQNVGSLKFNFCLGKQTSESKKKEKRSLVCCKQQLYWYFFKLKKNKNNENDMGSRGSNLLLTGPVQCLTKCVLGDHGQRSSLSLHERCWTLEQDKVTNFFMGSMK